MTLFQKVVLVFLFLLAFGEMSHVQASGGAAASPVDHELTLLSNNLEISVHYPIFNIKPVDQNVKDWAEQLVENFRSEFGAENQVDTHLPYQLQTTYDIVCIPDGAISIVWHVYTYTAGAHGMLDLVSFTYRPQSWQSVALLDLFRDLDRALQIMSKVSRRELARSLGDMVQPEDLASGTEPEADNFATFALTANGIRVYFQPYQVAPLAAGLQSVTISLDELAPAGPYLELWGGAVCK